MKAYVIMRIRAGEVGEVVRQMRTVPGVTQADMTFGPYDMVAMIEAPDLNGLGYIVAWQIQTIPGVAETITCLAVEPGNR